MPIPIYFKDGQDKSYGSIPRINWLHPLARGLIHYGYDIGIGPIDLVTGSIRRLANTAVITGNRSSTYGKGLLYLGAIAASRIGPVFTGTAANLTSVTTAAPFSWACAVMLTATPPTGGPTIFGLTGADTTQPLSLGCSGTTTTDFWYGANNSLLGTTAAGPATLNKFHTLLGVATATSTSQFYVDGKLNLSQTATSVVSTVATRFPGYGGLDSVATSQPIFSGFIYYGAIWKNRALSQAEAVQLHTDPYCFLIWPEEDVFWGQRVGTTGPPPNVTEDMYHQPWSTVGRKIFISDSGTG